MRAIKKGSTDQSVVVRIVDSTDGTPETGVVYNTAGIDMWYRREGAVKTSITEATLADASAAHSDGGFVSIGDGYYRLDLPDAAVATGANGVLVGGTVTGMVVIGCYIPLVDYDPQDAAALGLSRLDAAVTTRLAPTTAGRTLDVSAAGNAGIDWSNVEAPTTTLVLSGTTIGVVTALTGHTAQTGDAFARIGANGAGLSAVPWNASWDAEVESEVTDAMEARGYTATVSGRIDAAVSTRATPAQVNTEADAALADAGVTTTRTGYLDKLNVTGLVASAADIAAITQAQRVRIVLPSILERPDSGSTVFRIWIYAYDEQHRAEALDAAPVVTAENNAGTDRSANLSAVSNPSTGVYYVDYTVATAHAIEGLVVKVEATEGAVATNYAAATSVLDVDQGTSIATILSKVNTLHDTRVPGVIQPQSGDSYARLGAPAGASVSADVAAVKTDTAAVKTKTDNLPASPAAVGSAMTLTSGERTSIAASVWDALVAGIVTANSIGARIIAFLTGDAFARLGAPAGASIAADVAAVKADSAAIKIITDRLGTAIELDGAVYRFTTNALEQAPSGGGGGGGATMATAIPAIADTVDGTLGEAARAMLNLTRGKRAVVQVGSQWKLRIYEFDDATTVWATLNIDHPVAPSTAVPA